ncbi:MAG: LEA type 2 family protein [Bacteroidetes bacterium]|nr:LEA type 2 family protein [Bacteroidota bacterium]
MKKYFPFLLILFLCGCKLEPIVPSGVENVKIGNVDILGGTVSGELGLKIKNPNKFSVTVYSIDLDVTIAGVPMGHVKMEDKIKIEKNTEAVYPVKINAKLTDILGGIPKILSAISKKQSNVELKGSIKVGSGIFRHTFPININQEKVQTGKS